MNYTHENLPIIDASAPEQTSGRWRGVLVAIGVVVLAAAAIVALRLSPPWGDAHPDETEPPRPPTEEEKEVLLESLAEGAPAISEQARLSALATLAAEEPVSLQQMQDAISQL